MWEPKTLAPYEAITASKFIAGANSLQANAQNYIWAGHTQKSFMNVWRWDKKEPIMRFPLKDQITAFRISREICVGATIKGNLNIWQPMTGELISEIESAHYMEINDIAVSSECSDMIASAGKDCKVKVWMLSR